MTHYAYAEGGEHLELEADWVVVGSGAGGASAAVELARGGQKVAVVEAGAWRDPEHYPQTAYGGMRDLMPDFGASVTAARAQWPVVQGRCVGGSTVINSAIAVRTPPDIYAQWRLEHGIGDERFVERMEAHQDELESELGAAVTSDASFGRSNELAVRGATAMGYENHKCVRYARDCAGSGQCLQGCGGGRKQSLNLNFIPETVQRGGVVLSCAPVRRVLIERGRAVGVEGRFRHPVFGRKGARFRVRARTGVVMAASVVHSAPILKRSGVRHRLLAKEFRAHPGTAIMGHYDDPVDMGTGVTQGWASTAFRNDPGLKLETLSIPLELVAGRLKGGGSELMERIADFRHLAIWVLAVRAESVGSVGWGPFGPVVRYLLGERDMERMRSGAVLLARTHFAAGARWVIPGVYGLPFRIGPDELHLLEQAPLDPRCWVGILSHLFGGCTMGGDPERAVCDGAGRVYGVDGLLVTDASLIPTTLGVNPQQTIMALARHHAQRALERTA